MLTPIRFHAGGSLSGMLDRSRQIASQGPQVPPKAAAGAAAMGA
eukprot:SM000174S03378  [mRNA]  locus=s174:200658:200938:- [translate_table: standard]